MGEKPKVVVMCGSSRFVQEMAVCEWLIERDELAVTMGLNLLPWWYDCPADHLAEAEGCANQMDELHLRKIDLADEIFVVDADVDGKPYIGSSTSNEIAYAKSHGVYVRYFSETPYIRNHVRDQLVAGLERHRQNETVVRVCSTCGWLKDNFVSCGAPEQCLGKSDQWKPKASVSGADENG